MAQPIFWPKPSRCRQSPRNTCAGECKRRQNGRRRYACESSTRGCTARLRRGIASFPRAKPIASSNPAKLTRKIRVDPCSSAAINQTSFFGSGRLTQAVSPYDPPQTPRLRFAAAAPGSPPKPINPAERGSYPRLKYIFLVPLPLLEPPNPAQYETTWGGFPSPTVCPGVLYVPPKNRTIRPPKDKIRHSMLSCWPSPP